jgi:3-oxoacyl-[acyl-carrier-protein] synthase-3
VTTARVEHVGVALPQAAVGNDDLARENPTWDMSSVLARAGVGSRRIAAPGETAFDLSLAACEALVAETGLDLASAVDGIVYCTQSPDYVMPGNAHLLHRALGLGDGVLAFDYNLACSGYVYGLAFADSFVRSGLASGILVVTSDTYSKHINPRDRSARVLFGDGAAVTFVSANAASGGRIVATELCTHGQDFEKFYIPAGGMRTPRDAATAVETADRHGNVRSAENIHMDGLGVWAFINSAVPGHVRSFLARQSLTLDDIDLFVLHQASKMTLDSVAKALELPPEKTVVQMSEIGNLVSASIPVALRAALDEGRVAAGSRVLLCGFGVGFSYGSVLLEY